LAAARAWARRASAQAVTQWRETSRESAAVSVSFVRAGWTCRRFLQLRGLRRLSSAAIAAGEANSTGRQCRLFLLTLRLRKWGRVNASRRRDDHLMEQALVCWAAAATTAAVAMWVTLRTRYVRATQLAGRVLGRKFWLAWRRYLGACRDRALQVGLQRRAVHRWILSAIASCLSRWRSATGLLLVVEQRFDRSKHLFARNASRKSFLRWHGYARWRRSRALVAIEVSLRAQTLCTERLSKQLFNQLRANRSISACARAAMAKACDCAAAAAFGRWKGRWRALPRRTPLGGVAAAQLRRHRLVSSVKRLSERLVRVRAALSFQLCMRLNRQRLTMVTWSHSCVHQALRRSTQLRVAARWSRYAQLTSLKHWRATTQSGARGPGQEQCWRQPLAHGSWQIVAAGRAFERWCDQYAACGGGTGLPDRSIAVGHLHRSECAHALRRLRGFCVEQQSARFNARKARACATLKAVMRWQAGVRRLQDSTLYLTQALVSWRRHRLTHSFLALEGAALHAARLRTADDLAISAQARNLERAVEKMREHAGRCIEQRALETLRLTVAEEIRQYRELTAKWAVLANQSTNDAHGGHCGTLALCM